MDVNGRCMAKAPRPQCSSTVRGSNRVAWPRLPSLPETLRGPRLLSNLNLSANMLPFQHALAAARTEASGSRLLRKSACHL